ncbi:hypothetical protein CL633_03130 [bacterium]|nr:hypothetical protein [bacterium]|tara:strand:- start:7497 stop:7943 length:447 start_codon:yes stop_codon:yes gene_type:complete
MKNLIHFYFPIKNFKCRIICPRPLKEKEASSAYNQRPQLRECIKCQNFQNIDFSGNWINIKCKKNNATQIATPLSLLIAGNQECPDPNGNGFCKDLCNHRERTLYARKILIFQCSYYYDITKPYEPSLEETQAMIGEHLLTNNKTPAN